MQLDLFFHYRSVHSILWKKMKNERVQCLFKGVANRTKKPCLRQFANVNEMRAHQKRVHTTDNDFYLETRGELGGKGV